MDIGGFDGKVRKCKIQIKTKQFQRKQMPPKSMGVKREKRSLGLQSENPYEINEESLVDDFSG